MSDPLPTIDPIESSRDTSTVRSPKRSVGLNFVVLALLFVLVFGIALLVGSYPVTPTNLAQWISGTAESGIAQIISTVRLPRALLAALIGAALGITGPMLQGGFRTSLADPYLLGLSGFAALATVIFERMGLGGLGRPMLASIGALIALYLISNLSKDTSAERRALVGISIASVSIAGLALSIGVGGAFSSWIVGGLYSKSWSDLIVALIPFVPAFIVALALGRTMNLLQLGDTLAQNLGLHPSTRGWVLALACVLTGITVGSCGMLGFVALTTAGIARLMFGTDYRLLLPASALIGAVFISGADALVRGFVTSDDLPVGALTIVVGGIYLISLTRRAR